METLGIEFQLQLTCKATLRHLLPPSTPLPSRFPDLHFEHRCKLRALLDYIAGMRLTTDLINGSLSFINCLTERELDLRGALKRTDATLGS